MNIVKKMDYPRHDIFLNIDSDIEYRVRLHSCKKEPDTVEWVETFLESGDVLYDIGANIGAYSMVASKFHDGGVTVYAFEPGFPNYQQLCRNLALNRCDDTVTPFQIALSDETTIGTFNLRTLVSGGAVNALGDAIDHRGYSFDPAWVQPVLSYRTDQFIQQFELLPANHIKIDVDGTEYSILKGMDLILRSDSLKSILIEINPGRGQDQEIIAYLESRGLVLESRCGLNHLFVRSNWRPRQSSLLEHSVIASP